MNTLQAHGTTTHELTQKKSQPQDSHGHMTAANAMETLHTNTRPIHWPTLTKNATDQTTFWP